MHHEQRRARRHGRAEDRGFTLVEILVVVVVLGVLTAITAFSVTGTRDRTASTACGVEHRAVAAAIEVYQAQHDEFPPDIDALVPAFLTQAPGATTATGGGVYDAATGHFDPALC